MTDTLRIIREFGYTMIVVALAGILTSGAAGAIYQAIQRARETRRRVRDWHERAERELREMRERR